MGNIAAHQKLQIYKQALSPSLASECVDLSLTTVLEKVQGPQTSGDETCDLHLSSFHGIQCTSQQTRQEIRGYSLREKID